MYSFIVKFIFKLFQKEKPLNITCCPACKVGNLIFWFNKKIKDGTHTINKCTSCRSSFVNLRPSLHTLVNFYNNKNYRKANADDPKKRLEEITRIENEFPNSSLDAIRIVGKCKKYSNGTRLLDVGAGYGFISFVSVKSGFTVTALEPSKNCREVFKQMNGFDAEATMLTSKFTERHQSFFDVIVMSQVLEHVIDIEEIVQNLYSLLKKGGILAISVPQFRSWVSILQGKNDMFIIPPEHLNFFSREGLSILFKRYNFEVIHYETTSRINPARIQAKIKVPIVKNLVSSGFNLFLKVSDNFKKGMFITFYLKKGK